MNKNKLSKFLKKQRELIMKNKYFILTIIIFVGGLLFLGCDNNREEKVEDAQEDVMEAKQDLKEAEMEYEKDWQQFKNEAELKIIANEKAIEEFKAEILTASKKFKLKYEKEVIALEQKNFELKKKIIEYRYEGKDKWEEFKQSFNQDVDIVGNALKDIFSKNE